MRSRAGLRGSQASKSCPAVEPSREAVVLASGLFGLAVGSFLNVAIHRLPLEGESLSRPRRSYCPRCRHSLSWYDNIPVLSWVLLRGRCRYCRAGISPRYPLVELLTAALWALAAYLMETGAWGLLLVQILVLSGLLVSTFVDFDRYEIPDQVSIGGILIAPVASFLVPELHRFTWIARRFSEGDSVDRTGAALGSLAGILVGGGAIWILGWIGERIFRKEAMGFGDVKLLAAGGGFVGPGGALLALLVGAFVASVVGLSNVLRFAWLVRARARRRGTTKRLGRILETARVAGRYLPFGPYLGIGIGIVLLDWNDVIRLWKELSF